MMRLGQVDEAIAEMKKKVQIDPYSPQGPRLLGQYLIRARRYDEAIERIRKNLERSDLGPVDAGHEHVALGIAYQLKGLYSQVEELQGAVKINEPEPYGQMVSIGSLAHAYASCGRRAEALRELALLKRSQAAPDREFHIGLVYSALGDKDQAFQWLDHAFQERAYMLSFIKTDPRIDPLRSDPRYPDLLRRIGLPE
jgi:tetratricopeptide (TPR) repeat protein